MNTTPNKAITLINKLLEDVDNGDLKLTPEDWRTLNKRLKLGRQYLNKNQVTERYVSLTAKSIVQAFEHITVLAEHFTDMLDVRSGPRTEDTARLGGPTKPSLRHVQPYINHIIKLRELTDKIDTKMQQALKSEQESKPKRP